ncbi:hydrogenase small subunit [Adlercreutzia faecimuris]|uniref:Hydrogenase small subunit n=1 Tax=Adlercreutzia faecimuris TaxID=2897341 RepID=A0ABS9WIW9_9ACTN|nr:hydrogenase small subunit [Adlercreutzia sp. JBNU-10]MCI2242176.1 hydrogenase small subunit [Adlercreutzia sp. JBNU-10]
MENQATITEFDSILASRGVTRRDFMKLAGAVAVAAGLSELAAPRVAQALEESVIGATKGDLYPVIWIEGASCTGCTESFAQIETPDVATVVLDLISLNYSETLSAAAGHSVEEAKAQTIEAGNYILVYEGAVLEGWGGNALRVAGEVGTAALVDAAKSANAVVALGSCAVNGGWCAAHPNPSNAMGVQEYLKKAGVEATVVNVPGCPANPEWLMSVLVDVVVMKDPSLLLARLNDMAMPNDIFGQTIHDNCERRGHFENGEFVYEFGSEEEAKGYCLYPLGCRGPQTKSNCGVILWNNRRSWCVQAGAPCIGCCEANPNNPGQNWVEVNTPFYKRHRDLRIGDWTFQPGTIALALTGLVAAALVVHGFGMKVSGRMDGGADFEKIRKWDEKHPDKSIGKYDLTREEKAELAEKNCGHAVPEDDSEKGGQA